MKNPIPTVYRLCIRSLCSVYRFYADGFREMTLGKVLWAVILVKLFIIFVVLRLFFFPNFLKEKASGSEPDYVTNELIHRAYD